MRDIRSTQRGKILDVLISAKGDSVPLPKIAASAVQYNARIFELRRMGYTIKNKTQDAGDVRHSWCRLERSPIQSLTTRSGGMRESVQVQGLLELSVAGGM